MIPEDILCHVKKSKLVLVSLAISDIHTYFFYFKNHILTNLNQSNIHRIFFVSGITSILWEKAYT